MHERVADELADGLHRDFVHVFAPRAADARPGRERLFHERERPLQLLDERSLELEPPQEVDLLRALEQRALRPREAKVPAGEEPKRDAREQRLAVAAQEPPAHELRDSDLPRGAAGRRMGADRLAQRVDFLAGGGRRAAFENFVVGLVLAVEKQLPHLLSVRRAGRRAEPDEDAVRHVAPGQVVGRGGAGGDVDHH